MKVNQIMNKSAILSRGSFGTSLLSGFVLMLFFMFGSASVEAQSLSDWTGGKTLMPRNSAINVLKTEINRLEAFLPVQGVVDAQTANPSQNQNVVMEHFYYTRIADELVTTSKSTNNAVNDVTNAMIADGHDRSVVQNLLKKALTLLG
jgi:hypothetical protein